MSAAHLRHALWAANTCRDDLMLALGDASAVESLILLPMISEMATTCNGIESLIAAKRADGGVA